MNPKVSIIIPVYNGANYLREAIDSALNQTYDNIEIIVVNDGSNDNGASEKIALSYGDKIKYIAKENGGVSSALNRGIKEMTGDYFSWLSHDDLYTPDKIKNQISHITDEDKDCIFMCGSSFVDKDSKPLKRKGRKFKDGYTPYNKMLLQMFSGCTISGCALLIPKKLFENFGVFSLEIKYMQDTEMWYRFLTGGVDFVCNTDEINVLSRVHGNQTTVTGKHLGRNDANIVGANMVQCLSNMKKGDMYLLKHYMFLCCRNNSSKTRKLAYYASKEKGLLDLEDKFKYFYMTIYGKIRPLLVRIYYSVFLKVSIKNEKSRDYNSTQLI